MPLTANVCTGAEAVAHMWNLVNGLLWYGFGNLDPLQVGEYYAAARLDLLVRKEEIIGVKAIETYSDRADCLVYRSATYGPMPPGNDAVCSRAWPARLADKFSSAFENAR